MKVFAKTRTGRYNATGLYENGSLIILKGSTISPTESSSLPKNVHNLRAKKALISSQMELREDITFKSASTAASFVTGTSSNGLLIWKDAHGKPLKEIIK